MSKIVHPYAHRLIMLRTGNLAGLPIRKICRLSERGCAYTRMVEKKLRGMYVSTIEIERAKSHRFMIKLPA